MKHGKLITWLSAALLGISAAAAFSAGMTAQAAVTPDGKYQYEIISNEVTILKYQGSGSNAEIPDTIADKPVTKIGNGAFKSASISTLTVPPTVKAIGDEAFYKCGNLTAISELKAETVGIDAFYYCTSLKTISLPKAVTVGEGAFSACFNLESISLPKAENIGDSLFAWCRKLKSISLPLVEYLRETVFYDCRALTNVSVPKVQTIDFGAFEDCTSLKSITLPATLTLIEGHAFSGCTALTDLTILGPALLKSDAFKNCSALERVRLSDSSRTDPAGMAFSYCPRLYTVNGVTALQHRIDSNNGEQYPFFHSGVIQAVRNHFCRSNGVAFINDYCTDLCNYIVATETDPWMNDLLKARQLHDWIVRHCQYEDQANGEWNRDTENHAASSVFVSYALNIRGSGIGESVCEGYAQAYTMLLTAAGIESYVVAGSAWFFEGHAWNLIKIGSRYYETDPTWDDTGSTTQYSTDYTYYLKSDAELLSLHNSKLDRALGETYEMDGYRSRHPLLRGYSGNVEQILSGCTVSFQDVNHDGMLDYDFDLNGAASQQNDQLAYNGMLQFSFGVGSTTDQINNRMAEVLYWLHYFRKDYWTYINDSTPTNQTAAAGSTAYFTVTLFGDNLTYRWYCYDTQTNQWVLADAYYGTTFRVLSVNANASTNHKQFMCVVWNKQGYYIYSNAVTLTVV